MKNDEEVYMQLKNIQQQTIEHVEVYYESLLKLANYLQFRTTNVFLTTIFRVGSLPYQKLTTKSFKRNTLIEHNEVAFMYVRKVDLLV
jgi:DNA primase